MKVTNPRLDTKAKSNVIWFLAHALRMKNDPVFLLLREGGMIPFTGSSISMIMDAAEYASIEEQEQEIFARKQRFCMEWVLPHAQSDLIVLPEGMLAALNSVIAAKLPHSPLVKDTDILWQGALTESRAYVWKVYEWNPARLDGNARILLKGYCEDTNG
jgi:hypothetical protein